MSKLFYTRYIHILTFVILVTTSLRAQSEANPTPSAASVSTYDQLISEGNARLKAGDFNGAHQNAMKALGLDGDRFEAYALESLASYKEGKTDEAKMFIEIALAKVPPSKKPQLEKLAAVIEGNSNDNSTTASSPTIAATTPSNIPADSGELKGDDRLEYETLLSMLTDADNATGLNERDKILNDFMDKSSQFLDDYPNLTRLWVARAAVALELNDVHDGWEAGKRLKALGLEDSDDAGIQKVMVALNKMGWLVQGNEQWANSFGMIFVPIPGKKVIFCIWDTRIEDYRKFVDSTNGLDGGWQNPGFSQSETDPVVNVSWNDAKEFCAWLTQRERSLGILKSNQSYHLPTDEEWSKAIGLNEPDGGTPEDKDGKTQIYPWGNQWPPPSSVGNYDPWLNVDNYTNTSPVGSFPANQYGLYDMGGDVCQWCEDWYNDSQFCRTLRGAAWDESGYISLRSSARNYYAPVWRDKDIGFRCVLSGASSP